MSDEIHDGRRTRHTECSICDERVKFDLDEIIMIHGTNYTKRDLLSFIDISKRLKYDIWVTEEAIKITKDNEPGYTKSIKDEKLNVLNHILTQLRGTLVGDVVNYPKELVQKHWPTQ